MILGMSQYCTCDITLSDKKSMTNDVLQAIVITSKWSRGRDITHPKEACAEFSPFRAGQLVTSHILLHLTTALKEVSLVSMSIITVLIFTLVQLISAQLHMKKNSQDKRFPSSLQCTHNTSSDVLALAWGQSQAKPSPHQAKPVLISTWAHLVALMDLRTMDLRLDHGLVD